MRNITTFILMWTALLANAQNPIVPPGVYIADPSAHQWKDGKMYVYGSKDESPKYYCSWQYDVLSSSDLKTWEIHKNSFSSRGAGDQVPYADNFLYAPDCQFKNGMYYLYYCLATGDKTEGVATSTSPTGPFTAGKNINLSKYHEIDPSVFIDDDGKAYYVWGQFNAKMARLKPNLTEIDSTSIVENVITEKEHFFHEGSYLVKRENTYYLIYAHMGRAGRPTCLGYSKSKSPMGPFTYGGVIVDNDHSDPKAWNNHGSIAEFNGQWYVFYHRPTHGSETMRKTCVEPIAFDKDGNIAEVPMTTQGAGGLLDPRKIMDAERACLLYGNVRIQAVTSDNEELGGVENGDAAAYKYFSFDGKTTQFIASVARGLRPASIEIALDNFWAPPIGKIEVPGGGDLKKTISVSCAIKAPKGIHTVWLRFYGEGEDILRLDNFQFK